MRAIRIGDRVERIQGAQYQIGDTGTVVEIDEDGRLRVMWVKANKRTWVKPSVVRLIA